MNYNKSIAAFSEAVKYIPGGVNSPVRAFKSVNNSPVFIDRAKGSKVFDIDGNEYIDYVGTWGPAILGHADTDVVDAIQKAAVGGTSFGAPTLLETEMAKLISYLMPSIESVRMVNSGTEATMSALRLARGYTKRELVIKFEGCYHGHGDSFLIKAGSGALTLGEPNSPGVTSGTAQSTLTAKFNDLESVQDLFSKYGNKIAAVILEPITGNMGVIKPSRSFMSGVRDMCSKYGTILIFDEVMTGFRVARGGAQQLLEIEPDLTTLGKIIGGGLPVGAYGGKKEIMDFLAPNGPVYQAGTLSGNPLAMAAGFATLSKIDNNPKFYQQLEEKAAYFETKINILIKKHYFPAVYNRVGSMSTLFFTEQDKVESFSDVMSCNTEMFAKYFNLSLNAGIYMAPSQFEAGFISIAHSIEDLDKTLEAIDLAFSKLK